MDEPKDRLRQARLNAGYKTPAEAARSVRELNKNTLTSHENGNRDLSRQSAMKYGRIFGVNPGWLLYGDKAANDDLDSAIIELLNKTSYQQKLAFLEMLRAFVSSKAK